LIPDIQQPILFIADEGREEEVVTRLARVGYDFALGYLKGGFTAWKEAGKEVDTIQSISAEEFAKRLEQNNSLKVVDVRKPGEYQAEHVETAQHAPLDYLNDHLAELPKEEDMYLHCAGGYRSMIAASILKARGYDNVVNVEGGFKAIAETAMCLERLTFALLRLKINWFSVVMIGVSQKLALIILTPSPAA
jgi:hydroxyacylglutathione hydrolase